MTPEDVIVYIERKGNTFPRKELEDNERLAILAGGSIANAMLSILDKKEYPINDLDLFVYEGLKSEVIDKLFLETIDSSNRVDEIPELEAEYDRQYPTEYDSKFYMSSRKEENGLDIIGMCSDYLSPGTFPSGILKSFDLNCVQVGICYNGKSYEFVKTRNFDRFLATRQVEIVNIHSQVTFARLLKKTDDLQAYCDVSTEIEIAKRACKVSKLKPMTEEQSDKHKEYQPQIYKMLQELFVKPEDLYDIFIANDLQFERIKKIQILRVLFSKTYSRQTRNELLKVVNTSQDKDSFSVDIYSLSLLQCALYGYRGTLEDWLGNRTHSEKMLQKVNHFLYIHEGLDYLLTGYNLDQIIEAYKVLRKYEKRYGDSFIGYLESSNTGHNNIDNFRDRLSIYMREYRINRRANTRSLFAEKGKKLPTYDKAGIIIIELDTAEKLKIQGNKQKHCVGGYSNAVQGGRSRILSVYNKEADELSTLELGVKTSGKSLFIRQHYGLQNRSINTIHTLNTLRQYVTQLNELNNISDYLIPKKDKLLPFDIF